MPSKDDCNRALNKLIECKQRRLCDKCNFKIRCTMSNDKFIIKKLIDKHFSGIDNLNEVIEIQKNNLTSSYMFGLYNGLVTAKNILLKNHNNDELVECVENIKPYKFEDLKDGMWVWDGIEKLICQIGLISKNAIHRKYVDGTISDSPFEENRFYPPQMANMINIKRENKKQ